MTWTIAPEGDRLLLDGAPRFLLADTLWAAFSGPTADELRDYAELRRRQGFTAVLVSALPIAHDRSEGGREPFPLVDGAPRLGELDARYLAGAREALEILTGAGLTPAIVLLWNNYVPGTWGAKATPGLAFDAEQTDRYLAQVLPVFGAFDPIYLVSGDDHVDDPGAIARYRRAGAAVRRAAPGALVGWHTGPMVEMDDELADAEVDLHTFQSSHDATSDRRARELAAHYLGLRVRRPILNVEPCYEGHGYGGGEGRHDARSVRRALWASVLGGASAGLGYGAHGVWSWHRRGQEFAGEWYSGTPYPASVALGFPGAWDAGLVRELVETHDLLGLEPDDALVGATPSGVLAGSVDGRARIAVFRPHPFAVTLDVPAGEYDVVGYDLTTRGEDRPHVSADAEGRLRLEQPESLGDTLTVLTRRSPRA